MDRERRANRPMGTLVFAALLLGACGPINSSIALREAKSAIEMAREGGAPDVAPYEWTLAHEYFMKAREEQGYSDYKMSQELALKTVKLAEVALDAVGGYRPVDANLGGAVRDTAEDSWEGPPGGAPPGDAPPASGAAPPSGAGTAPGTGTAPPANTGAPAGVTVYTDPASGTRYYIDPTTGQVVYLPAEGQ